MIVGVVSHSRQLCQGDGKETRKRGKQREGGSVPEPEKRYRQSSKRRLGLPKYIVRIILRKSSYAEMRKPKQKTEGGGLGEARVRRVACNQNGTGRKKKAGR